MTGRKTDKNPATPATTASQAKGWVSFVGSGPGDPDLLTVRAVELLRDAEVVVTELPEHAALVRSVLGLPAPQVEVDEDGNESIAPGPVPSSWTAASARTASR